MTADRPGRGHGPPGLWARWSLRDLRRRWIQVAAIAVVIALGTGTYAGLTSSAVWRRISYDASYRATNAHDLRVTVAQGTTVPADALRTAMAGAGHPAWFADVRTTLGVNVQVDIEHDGEAILVPGLLVGVETAADPVPPVDTVFVHRGRGLGPGDAGRDVVVLDERFAAAHQLPATGRVRLGGDRVLEQVGTGQSPRWFVPDGEIGAFGARGSAVLFTSLERAQAEGGVPGRVDEAVVRLAPGVDPEAARAELAATLAARLPEAATEVVRLDQEAGYRMLYDDIGNDQTFFRVFALLILGGAAFAAFNLTGRIVEAQRREIGVGMALGVERRWLAVRPLLVAVEVGFLGALAGAPIGWAVGEAMGGVTEAFFPMPAWSRPFQVAPYLQATALGVGLVVAASVWPVVRAVRVAPVEAISTGPRATARSGLAPLVRWLRLPGSSLRTLPLRDALRRPRRTVLTALGIAAMVATLVGVFGMIDSIYATIDAGEQELVARSPDRMTVALQTFTVSGSPTLAAVTSAPGVGRATEGLRVGGTLGRAGTDLGAATPSATDAGGGRTDRFSVVVEVMDLANAVWAPTPVAGSLASPEPALVLSGKAARDLGVEVGGRVRLRHPYREGSGYRWVDSDLPVAAIDPSPFRSVVHLDARHAGLMNLAGVVNRVDVEPAPGADPQAVRRALFAVDGVGSVTPVEEMVATVRSAMDEFLGILQIVVWAVLLLAVLIAFNSSSISADERAREHATMFAFGLPVRTVLGLAVAESTIIGVLATLVGTAAGVGLTWWLVQRLFSDTVPELALATAVEPSTFAVAALLGVVAVALAPLLTRRRLRRMDIPSTLRTVE